MIKNVLITGWPGVGKTTLIKEIISEIKIIPAGFYTEEIRDEKVRIGFKIKNFKGEEGLLAHVNIKSNYRIGKYKVSGDDLVKIGLKDIYRGIKKKELIVIDEIGKMELLFLDFREAMILALASSSKVLGSISLKDNKFTKEIKERNDVKVINLYRENYILVKDNVLKILELSGI
ncbi:nucleoside-triphosphatase [bacterium]|nr:nucleoside-triphosphatase [bacterium]